MKSRKGYIFISYSHDDSSKVIPIIEEMYHRGYKVRYDKKIPAGVNWSNHIASRIKHCAVCVAFHSQTSRDSQHCREEIHYALKHKKTVISVYLDNNVRLEEGLAMQLAPFQSVRYNNTAKLLEALRQNWDFKRCGPDALQQRKSANVKNPQKRKGVNVKKIGGTLKKGAQFLFKAVSLLLAVSLLVAILWLLWHYVKRTPICLFDNKSGIMDIISPPFLEVEMTDYDYFNPPPWVSKTQDIIHCAVIRKGVTRIGDSSFENCYNMKFVFISEGVRYIDFKAFSGCTALEEITIPNSIKNIEAKAFSGCANLKTVRIQSSAERVHISDTAFDPGTKIIFEPSDVDADVVEYIWGSD